MYAHYFKSGKNHTLVISKDHRPFGQTIKIKDKKHARGIAKANNLKPYNY